MPALARDANTGWLHLLPPIPRGARVLCVDLAWRDSVQALGYFIDALVERHPVQSGAERLPQPDRCFDLVLCRMLGAGFDRTRILQLIAECARVLGAEGVLYIDIDAAAWAGRPGLRNAVSRALRGQGLIHQQSWPVLNDRACVSEILPLAGYSSIRNSWRRAETVKELVYGPGARWFAPGHAFLASRTSLRPAALVELDAQAGHGTFQRFIVNAAKSFYQPGALQSGGPARLFVLPGDVLTVERRRQEFRILDQLAASGFAIAGLLPGDRAELEFRGRPAFAMHAFDGITVDLPFPGLDGLFDAAHGVLRQFNSQTLSMAALRGDVLENVVGRAATVATARYPGISAELLQLHRALLASLGESPVPVVWCHGDYKLENLVFDRRTRGVQAVIDWELGCQAGLPMMDLLYLLAYREITLERSHDILDVLLRGDPATWSDLAARHMDLYAREFAMTEKQSTQALAAMFLHHIGVRYAYPSHDHVAMDRMGRIAGQIRARLAQ